MVHVRKRGVHADSLDPATFNRWYDFLQLYVAQRAPILASAAIHAAAPVIYQEAMGITGVTLPPDPIQLQPTYAGALTAFQDLPPIRVLFDSGAGGAQPGHPVPGPRGGLAHQLTARRVPDEHDRPARHRQAG